MYLSWIRKCILLYQLLLLSMKWTSYVSYCESCLFVCLQAARFVFGNDLLAVVAGKVVNNNGDGQGHHQHTTHGAEGADHLRDINPTHWSPTSSQHWPPKGQQPSSSCSLAWWSFLTSAWSPTSSRPCPRWSAGRSLRSRGRWAFALPTTYPSWSWWWEGMDGDDDIDDDMMI